MIEDPLAGSDRGPKMRYAIDLDEVGLAQRAVVGGKAAHLGELSRIEGLRVPRGFCVTTDSYARAVAEVAALDDLLDRLTHIALDDRNAISAIGARMRARIESLPMPDDIAAAVAASLARLGEDAACAVRSSATSEDSPDASFAGQHDSYLSVAGLESILMHVRRCWASLFTDRAITYRMRKRFDHRASGMAVVVQHMVDAQASGLLFTADPVSGNRRLASIEAMAGLGDALVGGTAHPDVFKVRDGTIVTRAPVAQPVLDDADVLRIAATGRRIEAHFGAPQDIEWCLAGDGLHIVQSRPITTLFPIPARDDDAHRVYLSVGHQQMMTDALRPLGISVWQLTAAAPMHEAGGRLFVDATRRLASPSCRAALLAMIGRSDPLTGVALANVIARGFVRELADEAPVSTPERRGSDAIEPDASIVDALIARDQLSIAALKRDIAARSGVALFDVIVASVEELKRSLFDAKSIRAIMTGMDASWRLNEHMREWLGDTNAADAIAQSAPNNVTADMGLALLDVADVIRPHADVVAFLERVEDPAFLDALADVPGGREAGDAIRCWLASYGMRCAGEIDITNARWIERPDTIVPILLGHVRRFAPGEARRRIEKGRIASIEKERELLRRLADLPDGDDKIAATRRMIARIRAFTGYREYPKYGLVSRYLVYKDALLREAARLVDTGVIDAREDVFYLTFDELRDVVRTGIADRSLIAERRHAFEFHRTLTPPRVLTSEGECVAGRYRRDDAPADALIGLAVSAGVIEGRARVVLDMARADVEPGDILVTAFTDPSWTPLFVSVAGLVTEVGGLMTHGAVIAREYGLPAVVGVEDATRRIRDGQRIRVDGANGYVEILD